MKIALTIPTGRPRIKEVVKAFIENAIFHGHNPKDFSIYLAIDTKYQNTKIEDFKLDSNIEQIVNKVTYITSEDRKKIGNKLINSLNLNKKIVNELFVGRRYSRQRNCALFLALLDNQDIAICIDDDEAPFIPIKLKNKEIVWKNLDFFNPHIKALTSGADITRGPYIGHLSPIPSDFENEIPKEIRTKLGEALEIGNEFITKDSFFNLINKIKYLNEEEILTPIRPFEAKEGKCGKHIFAGNMGINLNSVREGKIPIFFTPKEARGEDTIFSLQLKDAVVIEVNSFIFHDPFNMYPEIFQEKFPKKLKMIPITNESKSRFAESIIGWLQYAPILIKMNSKTEAEKEDKIKTMIKKIKEPTEKLATLFNYPLLNTSQKVLKEYAKNVEKNYKTLLEAQETWKNKIIPAITKSQKCVIKI